MFWRSRAHFYPRIAPIAEDFVCAPASEAYVESGRATVHWTAKQDVQKLREKGVSKIKSWGFGVVDSGVTYAVWTLGRPCHSLILH